MGIVSGVLLSALLLAAAGPGAAPAEPTRVIFDTDMDSDCDDAGALAVLHALADRGEAEILGAVTESYYFSSPVAVDVVNHYYGRGDIPIGVPDPGTGNAGGGYTLALGREFPHDLPAHADLPRADALCRRLLAAQPDGGVVIVTVGTCANMARLLETPPDEHSPLGGRALVARKVKLWSVMGGKYPSGWENNFLYSKRTAFAIEHWPTPVVFSGFEVGHKVRTGGALAKTPADNPVRRAYEVHKKKSGVDHDSWDLTSVLVAVRGVREYWDVVDTGHNHVTDKGHNEWRGSPDRDHAYLVPEMDPRLLGALLDELLTAPPRGGRRLSDPRRM